MVTAIAVALGGDSRQIQRRSLAMTTISEYEKMLSDARRQGNRDMEANCLGALGNLYAQSGNIDRGIECHKQALQIRESMGNRAVAALTCFNLASIYDVALGDFKTALYYANRAVTLMPSERKYNVLVDILERKMQGFT
jgi:tetratricopeptide (TPR) repeat protein